MDNEKLDEIVDILNSMWGKTPIDDFKSLMKLLVLMKNKAELMQNGDQ